VIVKKTIYSKYNYLIVFAIYLEQCMPIFPLKHIILF